MCKVHILLIFSAIEIPSDVEADAKRGDFEVAGYAFDAAREDLRPAKIVRVGAIQVFRNMIRGDL